MKKFTWAGISIRTQYHTTHTHRCLHTYTRTPRSTPLPSLGRVSILSARDTWVEKRTRKK